MWRCVWCVSIATENRKWLAAGFLLAGIGLWDKMLFAWLLAAIAAGALAAFPKALLARLRWRNLRVAVLWLSIGAVPLLLFNLKFRGETIRGNAALSLSDLRAKAATMRSSLDGSLLFGWIVADRAPVKPGEPEWPAGTASAWLAETAGRREQSMLLWASLAAALLLPVLWRTPARAPVVFALVSFAAGWAPMAVTPGTGWGGHHTLLVWPLPHIAVAVAAAEASRRPRRAGVAAMAVAIALVCGSQALVLNQYFDDAVRRGPGLDFNDATGPLAALLAREARGQVFVVDWGMIDSLRFHQQGRLRLRVASDLCAKTLLTGEEQSRLREWIAAPADLFVGHTEGREYNAGSTSRLESFAARSGFQPARLAIVSDSLGRPTYEVFRFRPTSR